MLVETSIGSSTQNTWTPPIAVHSWQVTTKPLWWWGRWTHWIVFMSLLYMCHTFSFVLVQHSVKWTNFCCNWFIYAALLVLVEHSVGSSTNNAWTLPLSIHGRHVTTNALWWREGWVHWIVLITSLYMYYDLSFVLFEHSVYHESIFILTNVFKLLS